jgi:uncharacterized protein (TIGR03435 family)
MRNLLAISILCLPLLPAQTLPSFEVASVKPCPPGTPDPPGQRMGMVRYIYPGGRFEAKATTVEFLIEWAYDLLPSQRSRGPAWTENQRFDIIAKANGNPSDQDMKLMVQSLLAERFKLKFHREQREGPVLVLRMGKSAPKLTRPKEGEVHAFRLIPMKDADDKILSYRSIGTRFSFAQLNQTFSRQLERVIVNETGLDGEFNFDLVFTPDESRPNPLDGSLVIAAIRDQLGFEVKSQRGLVDYLAIDNVELPRDEN